MMSACTESGTQAHGSSTCAVPRKLAIRSPREGEWVSMCRMLTN